MNSIAQNQFGLLLFAASLSLSMAIMTGAHWADKNADSNPGLAPRAQQTASPKDDDFAATVRPFLETYCFECHRGDGAEGDMVLSRFEDGDDVLSDLDTWGRVLNVLEQGDMPPDDARQPDRATRQNVEAWILKTIESSQDGENRGSVSRRLNRVEYENTIRDLFRLSRNCFNNPARIVQTDDYFQPASNKMPRYVLAVTCFSNSHRRHSDLPGVSTLPVDPPVEHGFANEHSALSLSPLLMENYLEVATALLDSDEFATISAIWNPVFVGQSSDAESLRDQARHQLGNFLPRAFRRELTADEMQPYFDLFESEFDATRDYSRAMKTTVSAVLVSPQFLFRGDLSPESNDFSYQFSMASRLSYFLWGSIPDDELFQAAREGRLSDADELRRQVRRMLNDRKIKSLSTDFGMQWLKLQKVASAIPDKDKFPDYYRQDTPPPATSMMVEQMLLFETILVENRSIIEFISADFGYLNRSLMDWYYLDPKEVANFTPEREDHEDFFRITWPFVHRGGIVTSGAMLVSTSTTTRSSPVYRGAWILDVVFNNPPPAPPANVPPLIADEEHSEVPANIRKRLEQHRADPTCATCHDRIDPLGIGLENYDAVARWRKDYENGDPVDASGDLDGDVYEGPARFKNVLLRRKDKFAQAFVEHTMKYALGRQLHVSDEPEIRRITSAVIRDGYRFDSVIEHVVLSDLFRQLPAKEN